MMHKRYIQTLLLAALIIWCCLVVSCSDTDDSGQTSVPTIPEPSGEPLTVSGLTRGTGDEDINYEGLSIWMMAVPTTLESGETERPVQMGPVTYIEPVDPEGEGSWNSTIYVKNDRQYEIFGILPAGIAESSSIDMDSYSVSSTTIQLNNMKLLSDKDVCVITGAITACPDSLLPIDWLQRGSYYYQPLFLKEGANNHKRFGVRLLADHLYASVKFKIFVSSDYNTRRTIKLTNMKLTTSNGTEMVNASITMNKSRETTTPFTFATTPVGTGTALDSVEVFKNDAGQALVTSSAYTDMTDEEKANYINIKPGYFGASLCDDNNDLYLVSTYDVYDKKGTKIREGCTAINRLTSKLVSGTGDPLKSGERVTITLTVNPTYLYVLSDPELDNPQVTIE